MTALTKAQIIVAKEYGGGDYGHLADMSWERAKNQLSDCGDTLFEFLMKELAASEGCDSLEEAARRIEVAADEIGEMADKVTAAMAAEDEVDDGEG